MLGELKRKLRNGTRWDQRVTAGELKDLRLWAAEEEMLRIDEKSWREKEQVLEATHVSVTHTEEFLRSKEKVSRQKEIYWSDEDELLRRKEKRVEEVLSKVGGNCLAGSFLGSEVQIAGQLLPGISNEITLDHITTKLSWIEVHVLKSVSRDWYSAIRNQSVYDARVRSHSTETFLLGRSFRPPLSLSRLRDNSCFQLPPIPYDGSPHRSVAVDGKVYVLGGLFYGLSDKVYMLDLAGKRSWIQVASMQTARSKFGCGVMDGKIYVFGGTVKFEELWLSLSESEVYDPKEDRWSSITPMISLSCRFDVAIVGEEFCLHGEMIDKLGHMENLNIMQIYHPAKDEWRKAVAPNPGARIFNSEGKLYSIDHLGIHVYSFDANSWTQVLSHCFTAIERASSLSFRPKSVLVVGKDDLLVSGSLCVEYGFGRGPPPFTRVFRSVGFDTEKKELSWQEEERCILESGIDVVGLIHL